jgi:hypothetical protein
MKVAPHLTILALTVAGVCTPAIAQKNVDKELREMKTFSDKEKARETKEQMRDKSHDAPRLRTGKDSSLGVDPQKGQVNGRKTF